MYDHEIELTKRIITKDEIGNNVVEESSAPVLCRLANVGNQEKLSAGVEGLKLSIKFIVHSFEYSGEKLVKYPAENNNPSLEGEYEVRSTLLGGLQNSGYLNFDEIELTCEKVER